MPGPNPTLTPPLSLYLNLVEELSVEQGQLLSDLVAVEIMQSAWPVGSKDEVSRIRSQG